MQISLDTTTLKVKCESCWDEGPHKVIHANKPIYHLRCAACRAVNVYAAEKVKETRTGHRLEGEFQDHGALMQRRGSQTLYAYSITDSFTAGHHIAHSKFGEGYVLAILSPPVKMLVLFADKKRMLACALGSTTALEQTGDRDTQRAKPPRTFSRGRAKRSDVSKDSSNGEAKCPVCGEIVHPFNIRQSPDGRTVGCIHCK